MWKNIRCYILGHVFDNKSGMVMHHIMDDEVWYERDLDCRYCDKKITEVVSCRQVINA